MANFMNGLLGNFTGGANMPTDSLLGQYYDPAAMRKYQMKHMLLGLGAGLLSEKGIGRGAALAAAAAANAGSQYRDNAFDAYKIKSQQDQQAKADQRYETEQKRQSRLDAQNEALFGYKIAELENPPPAPLPNEVKLWQYAQQNPEFGQYQLEMKRAGGTNIDNRQMGTIPPGYTVQYDEQNRPIGMTPIPGGPAAADAEKASNAATVRSNKQMTMTDTITGAAQKAREASKSWGATGLVGQGLSNIGITDAAEVERQVNVLKSNASIENLTAMRRESPTGGALGAVSDKENAMLAAAAGALDPSAGPERFAEALDNYELTLMRIVHGYEAGTQLFEQRKATGGAQSQQPPASVAPPMNSGPGAPNVRKYNPATGRLE